MNKFLLSASMASLIAVPGVADARRKPQPAPAPAVVRIAPTDPVELYYFSHQDAPIWTRSADSRAALPVLIELLRRSPAEGLANGPMLAGSVEAAMQSGNAQALEFAASKAWVSYVQLMKKAPAGMLFGYPHLAPQGSRPDQILLTAAAAPSLVQHLQKVSTPNAYYAQLRDASWKAMQVAPGSAPDPRILSNLERARVLPAGGRYILVNTAEAMLTMYDNGQPVGSMKTVVGMTKDPTGKPNYLPTPMIASMIYYVTFNPYWNVPQNLILKNIGHKARDQGESYLKSQGFQVMSDWTENATVVPYDQVDWKAVAAGTKIVRIRELPGAANSMGRYKFNFRNAEDIYLHDTPMREYFKRDVRTLSNGCIRLEDAKRLAAWLLGRDPVAPNDQPEQHVQLPAGVPVYVTYLTAKPQANGEIAFLDDYYGWDGRPDRQLSAVPSLNGAHVAR